MSRPQPFLIQFLCSADSRLTLGVLANLGPQDWGELYSGTTFQNLRETSIKISLSRSGAGFITAAAPGARNRGGPSRRVYGASRYRLTRRHGEEIRAPASCLSHSPFHPCTEARRRCWGRLPQARGAESAHVVTLQVATRRNPSDQMWDREPRATLLSKLSVPTKLTHDPGWYIDTQET